VECINVEIHRFFSIIFLKSQEWNDWFIFEKMNVPL